MDPLIAGIAKNAKKRESFWGRIDWEGAVDAVLEGAARGLAFYNQAQAAMDVLEMDEWGSARLSYAPLQQGFELAVEPGLLNRNLAEPPSWENVIQDHPGIQNESKTLVAKLEARQGKPIPVVEKPRQNKAPRLDELFSKPRFQANRSSPKAIGRGMFEEQDNSLSSNYTLFSPKPSSNDKTALHSRLQQQRWENQQHLQHAQQPRFYAQLAQAKAISSWETWFNTPTPTLIELKPRPVTQTVNTRTSLPSKQELMTYKVCSNRCLRPDSLTERIRPTLMM